MRWIRLVVGYVLAIVALLIGGLAVVFLAGAGGYEADATQAAGFGYLALALSIGLAAVFVLRDR